MPACRTDYTTPVFCVLGFGQLTACDCPAPRVNHLRFSFATTQRPARPTSRRRSRTPRIRGRWPRPTGTDPPGLSLGSGRRLRTSRPARQAASRSAAAAAPSGARRGVGRGSSPEMAAYRSGQKTPGPRAVHIAAGVHGRLTRRLLGGHVVGRPKDCSNLGQLAVDGPRQVLHQPEVEQFRHVLLSA